MSIDDVSGYMLDEVIEFIQDINADSLADVDKYRQTNGGQALEELALKLIRSFMEANYNE